jgi:hypothetical protein
MFICDGSGAVDPCDMACGRILGFIKAHINS